MALEGHERKSVKMRVMWRKAAAVTAVNWGAKVNGERSGVRM